MDIKVVVSGLISSFVVVGMASYIFFTKGDSKSPVDNPSIPITVWKHEVDTRLEKIEATLQFLEKQVDSTTKANDRLLDMLQGQLDERKPIDLQQQQVGDITRRVIIVR